MKVYFIGAGPGAADLITIRGAKILAEADLVMYAGSLVPPAVLTHCRSDAKLHDTSRLDLDQQEALYVEAVQNNWTVARVHSGDPAIYGAVAEQIQRLKKLSIEYEIVPGVSSFTASAASLGVELTAPEVVQTVILTRVSGRASPVPEAESLSSLAAHRATLCIFLSGPHLKQIQDELLQHYPPETPVALVHRASWDDEKCHRSTLGQVAQEVQAQDWALTTMLLVGPTVSGESHTQSRLYSSQYSHKFRRQSAISSKS